ncbi:hypothetical protein MWU75_13710 [Ornithinimicrobium sp. F0845]|uniref:hypothetical protein n=1 Tax=Ornithinimicrobium sp. F0845 TaxID=2926412 RepID=UPI001FF475EF|nr:hypothetical protein [Ornithinimicrobium sp. F0845]MCK0113199.1 hypothetical protein [Ornithinimicrobium sp. F0845]
MSSPVRSRRARGSGVLGIAACAALLAGCFGDPPPDPATAPLEVVLEGCLLNRAEVGAGPHDVALVGDGRLVVEDERGAEVLALPGGSATLVTSAGSYTVTCTVGSDESTSVLTSVPSSDG